MFVVCVEFRIVQGRIQDFLPVMRQQARNSLDLEPGCRQFDICRDPAIEEAVFLYELYDDAAAFQAHLDSAHFRAFDAAIADLVADKQVRILTRLD